jgi:hypothetical protein
MAAKISVENGSSENSAVKPAEIAALAENGPSGKK